ncbi:proteasome subunit alpha [Nanobdella aerobiophila]|uniref:Proteasome subunit alpha n=1 Tax=Nanobdella aerobiophila TaxID=2586965 RepID=A0A915WSG0_9ARCH|nr:archaeal proteasome endopeptidase complex subunit alpha [Nanobdella aerobiophila]BBL45265.1 proteasome subunit alpha [Nanobdella aerobiophila]
MDNEYTQQGGMERGWMIFSPEGKLVQVEYAKQAAKSGSTAIGIVANDGVVIVADKKIPSKLVISNSIEKILEIDENIIGTFSGFIPDGRVLIDYAREIAQNHRLQYNKQMDIELLVRDLSDVMQSYTRYGGVRPLGISLIIGGIDKNSEPKIYALDPSGIFYRYNAIAIGEGEDSIMKVLEEKYKDMSIEEAIKFGISILKDYLKNNFSFERIIVGYAKSGEKIRILENHEVKKIYEEQ